MVKVQYTMETFLGRLLYINIYHLHCVGTTSMSDLHPECQTVGKIFNTIVRMTYFVPKI